MNKIVSILPNYLIREEFGEPSDPPLGIAYISAVLENQGYSIGIIDANAENLNLDEVLMRLKSLRPDAVLISCNYSPLHNPTLDLAKRVKAQFSAPVIVGGNHATALADHILLQSRGNIDFVVRGEGERVILPLLEAILRGDKDFDSLRGITYRRNSRIISTPDASPIEDLDELPIPAYHLLPMDMYRRYNVITSRGCPFNCSFCAANVVFKRRVRYRSPSKVVDEIESLISKFGKKHVWFSDDTFTCNVKYVDSLLNEFLGRRIDITWSCLTRIDVVSRKLLEKMKKAGCMYISYGIESGNQEMLNKIGKDVSVADIMATLKTTKEVGLEQYGFFIVGFPGENWQTVMDSYRLIYNAELDGAAFNVLIPLPGTSLMNELIEKKLVRLDEIKWDYLFARTAKETYEHYSAELASRWCALKPEELISACIIGQNLPRIFKELKHGEL